MPKQANGRADRMRWTRHIMFTGMFLLIFFSRGMAARGAEANYDIRKSVFWEIAGDAINDKGVRMISYKQFIAIKNSGERYVLLDVLPAESYDSAHIEGAVSFPLDTVKEETAAKKLSKGSKIVVYCAGFQCTASTEAAKKLSVLGYDVFDYKGGLAEWQKKGNILVK